MIKRTPPVFLVPFSATNILYDLYGIHINQPKKNSEKYLVEERVF